MASPEFPYHNPNETPHESAQKIVFERKPVSFKTFLGRDCKSVSSLPEAIVRNSNYKMPEMENNNNFNSTPMLISQKCEIHERAAKETST